MSDLSFRRHVLVQALIITEFLLSLSAEAKQRLSTLPAANKAVVYNEQLSEENVRSICCPLPNAKLTFLTRQNGPRKSRAGYQIIYGKDPTGLISIAW